MSDQYINVNQEMDTIRRYIADIGNCTQSVQKVREGSAMYRRTVRMNTIAVIATIFAVACFIVGKMDKPAAFWGTIAVGVLIAVFTFGLRKDDDSGDYLVFCLITAIVAAVAIIFFMVKVSYYPVIAVLVLWVYTVLMNFRAKKAAWKIAQEL